MKIYLAGVALLSIGVPVSAQTDQNLPLVITPQEQDDGIRYLPAGTEVIVALNQALTTKGNTFQEGDTFSLTVQHHVYLDDVVVIPKGARAVGRITFLTSKGAFGKSGKMEIAVEYVEVNGRRIPLEGQFRQEGEGNTVATVGGVIAVGVFAGFITGKSGVIPRGRELMVFTREELPVRIARPAPQPAVYQSPAGLAAASQTNQASAPRAASQQTNWGLVPVGSN